MDDASTDGSKELLQEICSRNDLRFIDISTNIGNCAAFNKAFSQSTGKYVIDFATDDIMLPQRIAHQVVFFERLGDDYGVIFSNAYIIDQNGVFVRRHFAGGREVPQGDVFAPVLAEYFISPPTMMIKREVLEFLGGYDGELAYEDFDFWVRSSRKFKYAYQNECLTKVRKLSTSLSRKLYTAGDRQVMTTYKVCLKAAELVRNSKEKRALIKRLRYEARHAVLTSNFSEAELFFGLLAKQNGMDVASAVFRYVGRNKISMNKLRSSYLRIRYGE